MRTRLAHGVRGPRRRELVAGPAGDPPIWYGLRDMFAVEDGGDLGRPLRVMHYVPSLYLVASDPTLGGLPRQARQEHRGLQGDAHLARELCFGKAPAKVKKGADATLKELRAERRLEEGCGGQDPEIARAAGSGRRSDRGDRRRRHVDRQGDDDGRRHVPGVADGDSATGLATEYSITRRVAVY